MDETFNLVSQQGAALLGFGAIVGLLVNLLKSARIVKDGDAITVASIINFGLFCVLYLLRVLKPEALAHVESLDVQAAQFATAATSVLYFVTQVGGSKLYQAIFRGVPLLGKSFSAEQLLEIAKDFRGFDTPTSTTTEPNSKSQFDGLKK